MSAPTSSVSRNTLAAVAAGNALVFYDFQIFSFFSVQIGRSFFPDASAARSLLFTLGTFGIGFAARVLGAIFIGGYADRVGRKAAMALSFTLTGVAVIALASIPSAKTIGVAAPILLMVFRLLQGFAIGGEVGPAIAFLIETAPPSRRSLATSLQSATQGVAILMAGTVGLCLTTALTAVQFQEWGWRIAMLLGGLILPAGYYLRRSVVTDSPSAQESPSSSEVSVGQASTSLFLALMLLAGLTVANYVRTYLTTYIQDSLNLAASFAFAATMAQGLGVILVSPTAGWIADRVGKKRVALFASLLCAAASVPAFAGMLRAESITFTLAVAFATSALGAAISVPALTLIAESMPKSKRAGTLAFLYAITVAIFGGSTHIVSKGLIELTGNRLAPVWYQTIALLIAAVALKFMREKNDHGVASNAALRAETIGSR